MLDTMDIIEKNIENPVNNNADDELLLSSIYPSSLNITNNVAIWIANCGAFWFVCHKRDTLHKHNQITQHKTPVIANV